ncbi:hypothetical protein BJV78DRAFT_164998 [Lactifluus subvellereus]|nr:hypothetical protein BJV78DRAFT_164998 [Lactifluus subvellereus]
MSLSKYQLPPNPSPQLQVVLDYFKCLSRWDLEKLSTLSSPRFTQETLPASMGIPSRTRSEDTAYLKEFQDSLKSAPLQIQIYDINESKGKVWVHMLMNPVNVECFFLFGFGVGNEENLIVNVTEFVDSKVFTQMNSQSAQPETPQKETPQPETPIEALSSSVRNWVMATAHCYVDMLFFVPRSLVYVLSIADQK